MRSKAQANVELLNSNNMQAHRLVLRSGSTSRPGILNPMRSSVRAQSAVAADVQTTIKPEVAALFTPIKVGRYELSTRMVYPPLTRMRASDSHVPQPIMQEYYTQRATSGGLMITEGTYVNDKSSGYPNAPGVWTEEQVEAWKPIVKAVKDKGAIFFCQIFHCGRASHPELIGGRVPVGPSPIPVPEQVYVGNGRMADLVVPEELDKDSIKAIVEDFRKSARNALAAGFDGIEIHAANGYLIDQFSKSSSNKRTDEYGGSIENRCRFALEVIEAIVSEIGADRVGLRLSPFTDFLHAKDEYPYSTFVYLVEQVNKHKLAYLHMIEARVAGNDDTDSAETLEPFRKVFKGPFIAAGGYGYKASSGAEAITSGHTDLVAYGRVWLANPDLPKRFAIGAPFNKYDRNTFYAGGEKGYIDYPFLE